MELYLYWMLQIAAILALFAFNYGLLSYYTEPHERVNITLLIQVVALSSVLVYILLIPFDVFATVRHYETLFKLTEPLFDMTFSVRIYDLYFLCYVGMIYLCFIGLPFSYFYAQSVLEDEEMFYETPQLPASSTEKPEQANENSGMAEKTYKFNMKGLDSSDSDEESRREDNDSETKPLAQPQKQDTEPCKQKEDFKLNESQKRSAFDSFMKHSRSATKKTISSFVCLSMLLILSFIVSSYELHAQQQNLAATVAPMQDHLTEIPLNETSLIGNDTAIPAHHTPSHKMKRNHGKMKRTKHPKKALEIDEQAIGTIDEDMTILTHVKNQKHHRKFNMTEFLQDGTSVIKHAVGQVNVTQIMNGNISLDNWKEQVMQTTQFGEPFLRFTLTAIISIGALLKLIYLSYGLAGLPLYLIRGTRSLESESNEISGSISQVREKLRRIQEKYQNSQRAHISSKDQALLKKLRKEERVLNAKQNKITNHLQAEQNQTCWRLISVLLKLLTPFRVAIGAVCLGMSSLLIYSLLVNDFERLVYSECGLGCGYVMEKRPTFFNPLDTLLLRLSSHHEKYFDVHMFLDTTLFAALLLYVYICVLYGVIKIGINFFSYEIFKIRRQDTSPQALSIVGILAILMMFAFSMELMSIAPVYLTFGDQRLLNDQNDLVKCTLQQSQLTHDIYDENGQKHEHGFGCQMTMIAQLYNKMQLSLPMFSLIYFCLSWLFICLFLVFIYYHARKNNYQSHHLANGYKAPDQTPDDYSDDEDEDLQAFIKGHLSMAADGAANVRAKLSEKIMADKAALSQEQRCWDNQSALSSKLD